MSDIVTKRIILSFPRFVTGQPIITNLIRKFDLEINIYRAEITPDKEGYIAVDVTGTETAIEDGLKFIESFSVNVNSNGSSLRWDSGKCTSCGNCLAHCPTNALYIADKATRRVDFNADKCIECLSCIRNCPFGACTSFF